MKWWPLSLSLLYPFWGGLEKQQQQQAGEKSGVGRGNGLVVCCMVVRELGKGKRVGQGAEQVQQVHGSGLADVQTLVVGGVGKQQLKWCAERCLGCRKGEGCVCG